MKADQRQATYGLSCTLDPMTAMVLSAHKSVASENIVIDLPCWKERT